MFDEFFKVLISLRKSLPRATLLVFMGVVQIYFAQVFPLDLGPIGAPMLNGFGIVYLGLGVAKIALHVFDPHVSGGLLVQEAIVNKNVAAALMGLGRYILAGIILIVVCTASRAESPPPQSLPYLPIVVSEVNQYWPEMKAHPSFQAAKFEQETCPSLKSAKCWNPNTQLLTSREQGVGFSQLTRTFQV